MAKPSGWGSKGPECGLTHPTLSSLRADIPPHKGEGEREPYSGGAVITVMPEATPCCRARSAAGSGTRPRSCR